LRSIWHVVILLWLRNWSWDSSFSFELRGWDLG
jgi:hypothetical protein